MSFPSLIISWVLRPTDQHLCFLAWRKRFSTNWTLSISLVLSLATSPTISLPGIPLELCVILWLRVFAHMKSYVWHLILTTPIVPCISLSHSTFYYNHLFICISPSGSKTFEGNFFFKYLELYLEQNEFNEKLSEQRKDIKFSPVS